MQEFDTRQVQRRLHLSRTLLVALAVVAAGGVTFAAVGGATMLKNWILHVEINGQTMEVPLDENDQQTFTVDTSDGGTATVHVERTSDPESGQMTQVQVVKQDAGSSEVETAQVRCNVQVGDKREYKLADLGDAEPLKTWSDASGLTNALYAVPDEAGGSRLFLVQRQGEAEPSVNPITTTPFPIIADGVTTQFEVSKNGLLTITLRSENGEERVLKLLLKMQAINEGEEVTPGDVQVQSRDGQIKVQIEESDAGQ